MTERPLVVFDFDGVIVDGMAEYWWSAATACRQLLPEDGVPPSDEVPDRFRRLRPWVHHGWEMVSNVTSHQVTFCIFTNHIMLHNIIYNHLKRSCVRRGLRTKST